MFTNRFVQNVVKEKCRPHHRGYFQVSGAKYISLKSVYKISWIHLKNQEKKIG